MEYYDFEIAVENAARYYAKADFYMTRYNTLDAYEEYKRDVTDHLRIIMEHGHSYALGDDFVMCLDIDTFLSNRENAIMFRDYMGHVHDAFLTILKKEPKRFIYIPAVCPARGIFNPNTYKLLEVITYVYYEYMFISDCPIRRDFKTFAVQTKSTPFDVLGVRYYKWEGRCLQ